MSDKTRLNRLFNFPREKILTLCLATVLMSTVSAHPIPGPDKLNPTAHAEASFIDPNGLELEGAGSTENSVSLETLDLALLAIWASLTLAMIGMAVSVEEHPKRAKQASADPISIAVRQEP